MQDNTANAYCIAINKFLAHSSRELKEFLESISCDNKFDASPSVFCLVIGLHTIYKQTVLYNYIYVRNTLHLLICLQLGCEIRDVSISQDDS
jgi:hypothetical protein